MVIVSGALSERIEGSGSAGFTSELTTKLANGLEGMIPAGGFCLCCRNCPPLSTMRDFRRQPPKRHLPGVSSRCTIKRPNRQFLEGSFK